MMTASAEKSTGAIVPPSDSAVLRTVGLFGPSLATQIAGSAGGGDGGGGSAIGLTLAEAAMVVI